MQGQFRAAIVSALTSGAPGAAPVRRGTWGSVEMTDFKALDFFRDDDLIVDPYPYFEAIRAEGPPGASPTTRS